jgi:transcription antitermination factor NusG
METQIMETGCTTRAVGDPNSKRAGLVIDREFSTHWFAAYTNSHHEKRVASYFAERQIESFLPLYATRHRWKNGCRMKLELPLFPNYVFVRIRARDRVRVLGVPGVLTVVGFGRTPAPLPDFEIEALRASVDSRKIEPHPYLVIGERARIKCGPMAGMEGVLLDERFQLFVSDLAYNFMLKQKGYAVYYTPCAEVIHFGSQSINQDAQRSLRELHNALVEFNEAYDYFGKSPASKLIVRLAVKVRAAFKRVENRMSSDKRVIKGPGAPPKTRTLAS